MAAAEGGGHRPAVAVAITPQLALIRETHRVVLSWTALAAGTVAAFAPGLRKRELSDLAQVLGDVPSGDGPGSGDRSDRGAHGANPDGGGTWINEAATLRVRRSSDGGAVLRFARAGQPLDVAESRELRLDEAEVQRLRAALRAVAPRTPPA